MLKLVYPKEAVEKNIKENLEDLVSVYSQFYKFDNKAREEYRKNAYKARINAIASNLTILMESYPKEYKDVRNFIEKLSKTNEFDNLDPRDTKIKGLDKVVARFCEPTKEASFVLFNALLWLAGKEERKFDVREIRPAKVDLESLVKVANKEKFDYAILPIEPDLIGLGEAFYENDCIKVRLTRDEFEEYLLNKVCREISKEVYKKSKKIENIVDIIKSTVESVFPYTFKVNRKNLKKFVSKHKNNLLSGILAVCFLHRDLGLKSCVEIAKTIAKVTRCTNDTDTIAEVVDALGIYEGFAGIAEAVIHIAFLDPSALAKVARALNQYQGLIGRKEIAKAIIDKAYRTKDAKTVAEVAEALDQDIIIETLREYQGLGGCEKIANAIADIAYWTKDAKTVAQVAKTLRCYAGKPGYMEIADKIKKIAFWTFWRKNAVAKVAETLGLYAESEDYLEIARAIENTAHETVNVNLVIELCEKYKERLNET